MKNRILMMGMLVGCVVMPMALQAQESLLAEQMNAFNDAFKVLRRETDSQKGAAISREAQIAILKSLQETPALVKKMPVGAEREKAAAAYRRMLGQLFVTLCEVEEGFLAGDMDKVAKGIQTIRQSKKDGHDRFMED